MARQRVMSEQEYLNIRGVGDALSGTMDDRMRSVRQINTARGAERFNQESKRAIDNYYAKRNQARREYQRLVTSGKVRKPTIKEQTIRRAQGNPDNASVRAARRVAAKHGWSWKKGSAGHSGGVKSHGSSIF